MGRVGIWMGSRYRWCLDMGGGQKQLGIWVGMGYGCGGIWVGRGYGWCWGMDRVRLWMEVEDMDSIRLLGQESKFICDPSFNSQFNSSVIWTMDWTQSRSFP